MQSASARPAQPRPGTHSPAPQVDMPRAAEPVVLSCADLSELSDAALQQYISQCAENLLAAQRRYEQSSCFTDAGDRERWWHAEAAALVERGQRPHVVAAMERERGLD